MPLDPPYAGTIWSEEPALAINPVQQQFMMLTGAAAITGAGLFAAARVGDDKWNPIDTIAQSASYIGDESPFGILNTFRVSEFLSPLTSPTNLGLEKSGSVRQTRNSSISWQDTWDGSI
jgi:hypothetical protein